MTESIYIPEECLKRIFLRDNWVSLISNTKDIAIDVACMLLADTNLCTTQATIKTTSIIELKGADFRHIYLKVTASHLIDIKFFNDTQRFNIDFVGQRLLSCNFSSHPFFLVTNKPDSAFVYKKKGQQTFMEYLGRDKIDHLINYPSLLESLQWICSQQLQLRKNPIKKLKMIA